MTDLVAEVLAGRRRSLARLLTLIENEAPAAVAALAALYPYTGHAWVLGVTGSPGSGKSSLVNALALAYRRQERTVAIVAVDPTSPFTGGAILGDRIRMRDLSGDSGVFIRSMATRGSLGGLARATRDVVRALDAARFDMVIVETVGAGQSEIDIVRMADTTVVVEAPGMGDDVQAIKAGILEIADVLVVNKADRVGADQTVRALKAMLELGHPTRMQAVSHHGRLMPVTASSPAQGQPPAMWVPPVIRTVAIENTGIDELTEAIEKHRQYLDTSGQYTTQRAQNLKQELTERLRLTLIQRWLDRTPASALAQALARIEARTCDPQTAVEELLREHA